MCVLRDGVVYVELNKRLKLKMRFVREESGAYFGGLGLFAKGIG